MPDQYTEYQKDAYDNAFLPLYEKGLIDASELVLATEAVELADDCRTPDQWQAIRKCWTRIGECLDAFSYR